MKSGQFFISRPLTIKAVEQRDGGFPEVQEDFLEVVALELDLVVRQDFIRER